MKHLKTFESFLDESAFHAALAKAKDEGLEEFEFNGEKFPVKKGALKESLDSAADIKKLSDDSLEMMVNTFNTYHKNAKGNITDDDMEFVKNLMKEKQRRGLK